MPATAAPRTLTDRALEVLRRAGNPFRNYFARNPDDEVCARYHVPELFAPERDLLHAIIDLYRYDPRSDAWWEERWRTRGRSDWQIEAGLTSYEALRSGELDVVTGDFERLTGRRPFSVREVVERLRDELPLGRIEGT